MAKATKATGKKTTTTVKKPATAKAATKAAKPAMTAAKTTATKTTMMVNTEARQRMIAEAAYFLAERNGFNPSMNTQNWLQAEAQINAMLTSQRA